MSREAMQQALEALEKNIHYTQTHLQDFDAAYNRHPSTENERGVITDDIEDAFAAMSALRAALAEPEQEPWSTPERFYEQIDRAVENMRQRMLIRTVTMRCKDFDLALPIICAMDGHVLVAGTAPAPRKPLTDEEIVRLMVGESRARLLSVGEFAEEAIRELVESARAIERAHGIGEQT